MPGQTLGRTLAEGVLRVMAALFVLTLLGLGLDLGLRLQSHLWGPWFWAGLLPVALGIGLEAWGTLAFWKYGGGTPIPLLVLNGSSSRVPMHSLEIRCTSADSRFSWERRFCWGLLASSLSWLD